MFDVSLYDLNETLIGECRKLIEEHNSQSYTKVSLSTPMIEFSFISNTKPDDIPSKELTIFYEQYTYQRVAIFNISNIIDSSDYSKEDLSLNIDRSEGSILQLMGSLTGIRMKMIEFKETMESNIEKQIINFIDYLKTLKIDNLRTFLETLFTCMVQIGIDQYVDIETDSHYFVSVGVKIIESFYESIKYNELTEFIRIKLNELKQIVLKIKPRAYGTYDSVNRFQTFNMSPNDGENVSLRQALKILFAISLDVNDCKKDEQALETMMKQLSIDMAKHIGLIVYISNNDDVFFDMSSLYNMRSDNDAKGITDDMIVNTNLLREGSKSVSKKTELMTINTNDKTEEAYVLWTNDLKMFKLRTLPIHNAMIQKILRRSPSNIIEAYNIALMNVIKSLQKQDDAIAFKRVQNMSFTESITQESFLQKLKVNLASKLSKEIASHGHNFRDWVISSEFNMEILDTIDSLKYDMGIDKTLMSAHCHIIYNSMATKIIKRVKKIILTLHDNSDIKKSLEDIINTSVDGNDNIYTRVIASYYLHIA